MIRNRMPLRNLLLIVLIPIIFLMSCIGYGLSLGNYRNNEERWILLGCIIGVFLFSFIAIGIWQRKNIARIALIVVLYILVIGWTVLAAIWFNEMNDRDEWNFRLMPLACSFSMYCILFSLITFLNHSKLKEEFGIKED